MTSERAGSSWTCRPSLFVARMLGFTLAMLMALLAVVLFFRNENVLWPVLAVPVAIWVGFKGGPLLLRRLERMGAFGRVRLEADRLSVGRLAGAVRLGDPFEVDARLQTSAIEREHDMRDLGVTRMRIKHRRTLSVKVLSVVIGQDGRRWQLVADETNLDPGPAFETQGLAVRTLPAVNARVPRVRLWGGDLADVLGRLRASPGWSAPAVGEQPEPLEDPRRAFCPPWKVAVGALAIVAVFAVGSLAAYDGHRERKAAAWAAREARAEAMREEQETRARGLVGRLVSVPAQRGARMIGTVERYEVTDVWRHAPYRREWEAEVFLTVERLVDADGKELPGDGTVTYRFADNHVKKGDRIDADAEDVEPLDEAPADSP